jgi:hypothetical protein
LTYSTTARATAFETVAHMHHGYPDEADYREHFDWLDQRETSVTCPSTGACTLAVNAVSVQASPGSDIGSASSAARVAGTDLGARASVFQPYIDPVAYGGYGGVALTAGARAGWSDEWYVAPTGAHAAGTVGYLTVSLMLEGYQHPMTADDQELAQAKPGLVDARFYLSFDDSTGAHRFWSSGSITPDWSGDGSLERTLTVPFEYGAELRSGFELKVSAAPGYEGVFFATHLTESDFLGTARITDVATPFGTLLETGAARADAASYVVRAVPEPSTLALWLGGLAAGLFVNRRRLGR